MDLKSHNSYLWPRDGIPAPEMSFCHACTQPRTTHPSQTAAPQAGLCCRNPSAGLDAVCGSAIHHNPLGSNRGKKKSFMITLQDLNDDCFSNALCSCLTLSQLEEKNSPGEMEMKAQHCFTGRSELKDCFYKGCLLYVLHQCIGFRCRVYSFIH